MSHWHDPARWRGTYGEGGVAARDAVDRSRDRQQLVVRIYELHREIDRLRYAHQMEMQTEINKRLDAERVKFSRYYIYDNRNTKW